ncbi:hypothetical protein SOVF_151160 [Spinacia oleracea]|nr:hypothetical protein SOVF_151160 [Spinacia oleracea]
MVHLLIALLATRILAENILERRSTKDWICDQVGGCLSNEECQISCQEKNVPPMIQRV